jgi:hypothetical protein
VFILKTVKVICFGALMQVLILNDLREAICTIIVQNAWNLVSVENKSLRLQTPALESKNAGKLPALRGIYIRLPKQHYTLKSTFCQDAREENLWNTPTGSEGAAAAGHFKLGHQRLARKLSIFSGLAHHDFLTCRVAS